MRKVTYFTSNGMTTKYSEVEGRPHITILEEVKEEMSDKDNAKWAEIRKKWFAKFKK